MCLIGRFVKSLLATMHLRKSPHGRRILPISRNGHSAYRTKQSSSMSPRVVWSDLSQSSRMGTLICYMSILSINVVVSRVRCSGLPQPGLFLVRSSVSSLRLASRRGHSLSVAALQSYARKSFRCVGSRCATSKWHLRLPPNLTVNRTRRFMPSLRLASGRRAGYLQR